MLLIGLWPLQYKKRSEKGKSNSQKRNKLEDQTEIREIDESKDK